MQLRDYGLTYLINSTLYFHGHDIGTIFDGTTTNKHMHMGGIHTMYIFGYHAIEHWVRLKEVLRYLNCNTIFVSNRITSTMTGYKLLKLNNYKHIYPYWLYSQYSLLVQE